MSAATETVLLCHGLAENSLWMTPLAMTARLAGFRPHLWDYPSTRHPIEVLTERHLHDAVASLAGEETLHVITHSMGGIMLLYYLQRHRIPNLGRIVMLTPGFDGSPPLSLYRRHPLFSLLGPAGIQSASGPDCFSCRLERTIPAEAGIITGCVGSDPAGWLTMPWPHDGKTTVAGTYLDNMKDHLVVPASHDLLLYDPAAHYQSMHFLRHGRFNRAPLAMPFFNEARSTG